MWRVCVLAIASVATAAEPLDNYTKLQRQVLAWLTPIGNVGGGCGAPPASPCNVSALAEACSNASVAAPAPVPCVWSSIIPNTYILGCPASNTVAPAVHIPSGNASCVSCQEFGCFTNVADAQAACDANPACGGITSEVAGTPWELRSLAHLSPAPPSQPSSSYQITNQGACGHAPPPPPPGSDCNAFDTNGNLYHWWGEGGAVRN